MKKVIAPIQKWLLRKGMCVACAMPLSKAERELFGEEGKLEKVTCKCRRVFIYDKEKDRYRRAEVNEV